MLKLAMSAFLGARKRLNLRIVAKREALPRWMGKLRRFENIASATWQLGVEKILTDDGSALGEKRKEAIIPSEEYPDYGESRHVSVMAG
jgi:hypothetical protein